MKIRYNAPKGYRVNRYMYGISCSDMWWSDDLNMWFKRGERRPSTYTNIKHINTLKAAKRHIRKHPELWGKWCTLECKLYSKKVGSLNIMIKK